MVEEAEFKQYCGFRFPLIELELIGWEYGIPILDDKSP
jgi:hypothetical protein